MVDKYQQHFFFDFDDVLFDTGKFITDFKSVFAKHGIDEQIFASTCKSEKSRNQNNTYNFSKHIDVLQEHCNDELEELQSALQEFMSDTSEYLVCEMINVLKKIRFHNERKNEVKIYIVSYGSPQWWQKKKIISSGVGEYIDGVVAGEIDKGKEIYKILSKHEVLDVGDEGQNRLPHFFVDDRASFISQVKVLTPQVRTILYCGDKCRFKDRKTTDCDYVALNAIDVMHSIRSCNE